jgi:4-hydroxybenzoate polyprenyltransferase
VIRRWGRYVGVAYRPAVQIPYTVFWAVGLTALFATVTGAVVRWRPGADLLVTVVTLMVTMLLIRALDDLRDLEYDRALNPRRPLPSGMVRQRDLYTLVAVGGTLLLALNAGRGTALAALVVQMVYTAVVIVAEIAYGWPPPQRLVLQVAVNLPILSMLSLYVYAGFLRAEDARPNGAGFAAVAAVTLCALAVELGRKTTRRPRPGERTYAAVFGASRTSAAGLFFAVLATIAIVVLVAPWRPGAAWGWLVLAPLALPVISASRFAAGDIRWPVLPTVAYVPVMYLSLLVVGWQLKGTLG